MKKLSPKNRLMLISMAAIFLIIILFVVFFMSPQGTYITTGHLGKIVNGKYYYMVGGKGVYEYTPGGESTRLMKSWYYKDGFGATEDGIYLQKGKKIYFYDFETCQERLFFDATDYDCPNLSFDIITNDDINIVLYNKHYTAARQRVLQGKTGQIIIPVSEELEIGEFRQYSGFNFYAGDRYIQKEIQTDDRINMWYPVLKENGESLLSPADRIDTSHPNKSGDDLVFSLYTRTGMFIVRADGNDEIIEIPRHYESNICGDYAFSINNYSEIWCIDIHTGECWWLNEDSPVKFSDITTDSNYVYTTLFGDKTHTCWEIVKDASGKPVKAVLVTDKL